MADEKPRWSPPATTPEIRENQLVVLATDLAEQQLREGVASSAVIVHYLKLAGERNKLENEKLKQENSFLKAKAEALDANKRTDVMYKEAIKAMREYSGAVDEVIDEDIDDY